MQSVICTLPSVWSIQRSVMVQSKYDTWHFGNVIKSTGLDETFTGTAHGYRSGGAVEGLKA